MFHILIWVGLVEFVWGESAHQSPRGEGTDWRVLLVVRSVVASPKVWEGGKMFDFRRITLFCLEKRLSKHKMTIFSKNLGGMAPFPPWLRLWWYAKAFKVVRE